MSLGNSEESDKVIFLYTDITPGLQYPVISGQHRPSSDSLDAQSGVGFCCPQMPQGYICL